MTKAMVSVHKSLLKKGYLWRMRIEGVGDITCDAPTKGFETRKEALGSATLIALGLSLEVVPSFSDPTTASHYAAWMARSIAWWDDNGRGACVNDDKMDDTVELARQFLRDDLPEAKERRDNNSNF